MWRCEGDEVEMTKEEGPWAYGIVEDERWFPTDFVKWNSVLWIRKV